MLPQTNPKKLSVIVLCVVLLSILVFGFYKYYVVAIKLIETEKELTSTIENFKLFQQKVFELQASLLQLSQDKENQSKAYQDELKDADKKVQDLKKLTETDPQLLAKYSKVYFLNENYAPPSLVSIDEKYLDDTSKPQEIHKEVEKYLKRMLGRALRSGIKLTVTSAYRSFSDQLALKAGYKVTYGAGTANKFSAEQGYSEHQLGTTVDLNYASTTAFVNFENSDAYKWLLDNAYEYGFVISYPKGNVYYQFEPWHWRFVGLELAHDLHEDDQYFYDLSQRDINKYLLNFFD